MGRQQAWIGYHLSLNQPTVGLTDSRASAVIVEGVALVRARRVSEDGFHSFVGKLGFCCQVLSRLKPLSQPLYAVLALPRGPDFYFHPAL